MPATKQTHETTGNESTLPIKFYPPRLSDSDLSELDAWADRAMGEPAPAPRFAAYLNCVAEFERERRFAADTGREVLEAYMTPLPCPVWSNREVAHALAKVTAMSSTTTGEVLNLIWALEHAIVAECQFRLDPHGPNGSQVDRAYGKQ